MSNVKNFSHEHGHKNMAKHKMFNAPYIAQPSDTTRSLNPRRRIHSGLCRLGSWNYLPQTAGDGLLFFVRVIKSRRMRWAGHVTRMGEERGVYRVLVGKPEGRRPLGRPRRRRVDNIRVDLQEVGCGYMD